MRPLPFLAILLFAHVASAADTSAPTIDHVPPKTATKGRRVTLSVRISDESEVFLPALHLRMDGADWRTADLRKKEDGSWSVQLEVTGDLDYWIEAYDEHGNGPAKSGTQERPHHVRAEAPKRRNAPQTVAAAPTDTIPPELIHKPLAGAQAGETVTITAVVTDPSGVFASMLYTRPIGGTEYESQEMKPRGDRFFATSPLTAPFDYWLEAYDNEGNGPTRSGTPEAPHRVALLAPQPAVAGLPAAARPEEEETGIPTRWWVGGAIGAVGAAVAGVVVYSLASHDDNGTRLLLLNQGRR